MRLDRRDFVRYATVSAATLFLRPFTSAFADDPKVSWGESRRSVITPELECALRAAKASGQKTVDAVITLSENTNARELCETPAELINSRGEALFDYRATRFKEYIGYNDKTQTGLGVYLSNIKFDPKKNRIFVTVTTAGLCCATCTPSFLKAEPQGRINLPDFSPEDPDEFEPFYRLAIFDNHDQMEQFRDAIVCEKNDTSCIVKCDSRTLKALIKSGCKIDWTHIENITTQKVRIACTPQDYKKFEDFTFDVIKVTNNEIIGITNDGEIRELSKAGFEVTIIPQRHFQFLTFNKEKKKFELSKDELEKYLVKANNPGDLKLMLGYMGAEADGLNLDELKDKLKVVAPLLVRIFNERHLTGKEVKIIEPKRGKDLIDVTEKSVSPEGFLLAVTGVVFPHVSLIEDVDLDSIALYRGRELFEYGSVKEGMVREGILLQSKNMQERKIVPLGIPIFIPGSNRTYYIDAERFIAN